MNTPGIVLSGVAVVLSLSAILVARNRPAVTPARDADPGLARLHGALESLRLRIDALERSTAEDSPPQRADGRPITAPQGEAPSGDVASTMASLLDKGLPREEMEGFLKAVRKTKAQGAFLKAAEERVASHSGDAKGQYLLARALIEQLMVDPTYEGKDRLGNRALAEYDKALVLDPRYWEPRFEKAESLTYYPESLGRTPEAIREFEALLALQGKSNHDPRYAATYSHLGRMYLRIGKSERALKTVQEGIGLFPEDEDLRAQLEVLQRR